MSIASISSVGSKDDTLQLPRICEVQVSFHLAEERQLPVRLVALRLTEKQRQAAQKRKYKKASQRGKKSKPTADTLYLAGWLIVVTTLPAEQWSAQEVLSLYRARWHIEFFFKRFKQLLDVHQVTCVHQERVQAGILVHLLARERLRRKKEFICSCSRQCGYLV